MFNPFNLFSKKDKAEIRKKLPKIALPVPEPEPLTRKQILILKIAELQEELARAQKELKEENPFYSEKRSHHKKYI